MRTLVLAPASAAKRWDVAEPATARDLGDLALRREAEARLAAFACPAEAMYADTHHRMVMAGLRAVWERWGQRVMDLAILSPGYGLLHSSDLIVPYAVSFEQFEGDSLTEWVDRLRIPERVSALMHGYELALCLLSGEYLDSIRLPANTPGSVQQILLVGQEDLARIPLAPNLHTVVADGPAAARRWHVPSQHVRAFLFGRLCGQIEEFGPPVLEWLHRRPQDVEHLFYKRARWQPQLSLW